MLLINNDIWLTQSLIAELFGVGRSTITEHINNILKDGELLEKISVGISDESTGGRKSKIYNLDLIIAVRYRVNSKKAIQFRIWATKVLKEYLITGVVMDDERLQNPNYIFGEDYFERTLKRIRNIRFSERRFYQKITDIYSSCSIDYDKDSEITKTLFKTVQNKLTFSATGNTAAEIIYNRVDSEKDNMGLTNWKNSPRGKILETDVIIAKNYLNKDELESLGLIVSAFLDLAENRAKRHIPMTMEDWAIRIDKFLLADDLDVLKDAGKISHEIACDKALSEFERYRIKQDKLYKSDFDLLIEEGNKVVENNE